MKLLQGLFRSRDKPQNRTAGSGYSFFFGGTTSGKAVTERSAMQMTAVYACVRILSEAIAGLPLHLYRYKDGGGKEKAVDHPLYLLLHDEPNPEMGSFVFRETLMTHLLLWGNAYAQIIRNGKGEVIALYPLMPNKMTVDRDADGHLYYKYMKSTDETQFLETRKFQINEIARIFRVSPHMLGDLEKSSFSNIEQQLLEFVKYTHDPWVLRWEQSIYNQRLTSSASVTGTMSPTSLHTRTFTSS